MANSLVILNKAKQNNIHLICFPYAASISNVFGDWPSQLLDVEVCIAPYPELDIMTAETVDKTGEYFALADSLAYSEAGGDLVVEADVTELVELAEDDEPEED